MKNFLSSYVLSILGIVLVAVLAEFIISNGKMQKTVRTIVSIFIILIVLKPIKSINIFDLDIFNSNISKTELSSSFIENTTNLKLEKLKQDIEKNLNFLGYKNVFLGFDIGENGVINNIYVDLSGLVLTSNDLNINKYTSIIAVIKQFVTISEGSIFFYE